MALVSEFLYQHLLDWLCPSMEAEYKRLYSKGKDGIDREQCVIVGVKPIEEKK